MVAYEDEAIIHENEALLLLLTPNKHVTYTYKTIKQRKSWTGHISILLNSEKPTYCNNRFDFNCIDS